MGKGGNEYTVSDNEYTMRAGGGIETSLPISPTKGATGAMSGNEVAIRVMM